jgi:NADH dehydrogenase
LSELDGGLGIYAAEKLSRRGVEIRLQTAVTSMSDRGVTLSDGTSINTRTLIWTAGTAPNPLLAALACSKEKGKLIVDENLEIPGLPGVWALGDCAAIRDRQSGKLHPPTAQHALRQGKVVAHNVIATVRGAAKKPFVSPPSANSPPSAGEPEWRTSWASTSPVSSPGGCGELFI